MQYIDTLNLLHMHYCTILVAAAYVRLAQQWKSVTDVRWQKKRERENGKSICERDRVIDFMEVSKNNQKKNERKKTTIENFR